jgi:4-hydroxy-tetrahydrodipicolinate synthase
MPSPLRGIIPPIVTPLKTDDQLDLDGLTRLLTHLLSANVHGLFVMGTTGEGASLGRDLKRQLIHHVCRQAADRVPVLVNVTDTAMADAISLAHHAADQGAHAIVVAAPYYVPITDDELVTWFRQIAATSPLPVLLYNMPSHVKIEFTPDTIRRVLDVPKIIGFKDSAKGATCFHQVRTFVKEQRPDFSLLIGPEALISQAVPLGAHGAVSAGGNLFPSLLVNLYNAAATGDTARAAILQSQVQKLGQTIYTIGSAGPLIRGLKAALALKGICSDDVAPPLLPLTDDERRTVAHYLDEVTPV